MKKTPLRRASVKRAKQLREYAKAKIEFLSKYTFCECTCGNHHICTRRSSQIHHMKGRSGAKLLDQRYWLAICPACHEWIHSHARQARATGLLQ